jgi:hypothetical protein
MSHDEVCAFVCWEEQSAPRCGLRHQRQGALLFQFCSHDGVDKVREVEGQGRRIEPTGTMSSGVSRLTSMIGRRAV